MRPGEPTSPGLPRVVVVTTGTELGGAELVLANLVEKLHGIELEIAVVALCREGPVADRFLDTRAAFETLGLARARVGLRALPEIRRKVAELRPDAVVGWMYHGNLAAWWAARSLGARPLLFNVRHTPERAQEPLRTALAIRLGGRAALSAQAVVFNSYRAAERHLHWGYPRGRRLVVPNGVDCDRFRPDPSAGSRLRERLGLSSEHRLVGRLARFHPMKGFGVLLGALARTEARVQLVIGGVAASHRAAVSSLARRFRVEERVHHLGILSRPEEILPGFDLVVSSSTYGESFPNVVAEAMACGVPVVATDVGASRELVGDGGEVVPPGMPEALAASIARMLAHSGLRSELGRRGRRRVEELFTADRMLRQHAGLWTALAQRRHPESSSSGPAIGRRGLATRR